VFKVAATLLSGGVGSADPVNVCISCLVYREIIVLLRVSLLSGFAAIALSGTSMGGDWSRFRGPNGSGVADSGAPIKFGESENLKWKSDLPGRGCSSPIVVGDKVFVTCYSGYGTGGQDQKLEDLKRHLVCVDRNSGETVWTKTVAVKLPEDPFDGNISSHGYASNTPVSDGKHVFAFFGKSGVHAYDLDGNELWVRAVGTGSGRQRWGSGASPIVFEDFVVVNASDEAESIIWLDKKTGKEMYRAEADGLAGVWSTPIVSTSEHGPEVVISAAGEIWGLNATNGKLRWYAAGGSDGPRASVLGGDGVVYAMSNRGGRAVAVRLGGKGDVSESNTIWDGSTQAEYATPLLHDGYLYSFSRDVVTCLEAESGDRVFQKRLSSGESVADEQGGDRGGRARGGGQRGGPERGGQFGGGGGRGGGGGGRPPGNKGDYASPVLADGKIYMASNSGTVFVIAATPKFELLATNDMTFDSSGFGGTPAISDGQMFLRSHTHLYCIAED
jgi:outer membrane protein assembly factor BamB